MEECKDSFQKWAATPKYRKEKEMKIINETNWDTSTVRKLLSETLRRYSKVEGRLPDRFLEVEIVTGNYSGWAFVHGRKMRLRIPRQEVESPKLAELFHHEMDHIMGYRHSQMPRSSSIDPEKYQWALEYPIMPKIMKLKVKEDIVLQRYEKVLFFIKEKEKIINRNKKLLTKYLLKKRYYEKALAAAGKLPAKASK